MPGLQKILPLIFCCLSQFNAGFSQSVEQLLAIGSDADEIANAMAAGPGGTVIATISFTGELELGGQVYSSRGRKDVLLFRYSTNTGALGWVEQLGSPLDDEVPAVRLLAGGEFMIAGEYGLQLEIGQEMLTNEQSTKGLYLARFAANGQPVWVNKLNGSGVQHITDLTIDPDDNVIVTGYYEGLLRTEIDTLPGQGDQDLFVIKYDSVGNVLWSYGAGGSGNVRALKVRNDSRGNLLVAGTIDGSLAACGDTITANTSDEDVFVMKLNATGECSWLKKMGGVFEDNLRDLELDAQQNSYVFGDFIGVLKIDEHTTIQSQSRNPDLFLLVLDEDGELQRATSYPDPGSQQGVDLNINSNSFTISGIYRGGWESAEADLPETGQFNGYLIELDSNFRIDDGVPIISEEGQFFPNSVAVLQDQSVLLLATFSGTPQLTGDQQEAKGGLDAGIFKIENLRPVSTTPPPPQKKSIEIYPNPSRGKFQVKSSIRIDRLELINQNGQVIRSWSTPGNVMTHEGSLPAGMYFLKIYSEAGIKAEMLEIH